MLISICRYDSILLLILFALYICVKVGLNSGKSSDDTLDDNNNLTEEPEHKQSEESEDDNDNLMNNKVLNVLLRPVTVMFELTMPGGMSPMAKFFISITWLSTLSYFSVNAITEFSNEFYLP